MSEQGKGRQLKDKEYGYLADSLTKSSRGIVGRLAPIGGWAWPFVAKCQGD